MVDRTENANTVIADIDLHSVDAPRIAKRLVLKPNDEYGGKGIVLGWTVDDDGEWNDAHCKRRARREPHIVQERVTVVPSEIMARLGGQQRFTLASGCSTPHRSCLTAVVMAGCLTRIATDPLY